MIRATICCSSLSFTYGPLDLILIGPAYEWKTKEGIGIGSSISEVRHFYGSPLETSFSPENHLTADFYCSSDHMFQIHYEDSIIPDFRLDASSQYRRTRSLAANDESENKLKEACYESITHSRCDLDDHIDIVAGNGNIRNNSVT